jgi:hypothetical protein
MAHIKFEPTHITNVPFGNNGNLANGRETTRRKEMVHKS